MCDGCSRHRVDRLPGCPELHLVHHLGVTDRYGSTTESGTYPPQLGDDLIFDRNLAPKAAFTGL